MYGICADLHFHNWTLFSATNVEGINTRLQGVINEFKDLCKEVKAKGGERVYIAGDVFHVRGSIKPSVMNPVVSAMIGCATENGLTIRVMPGNHDLEGAEVTFAGSSIIPLQHHIGEGDHQESLVSTIQAPTFFEDDMVAMIPWQNTRAGMNCAVNFVKDYLDNIGLDPKDVDLIMHVGINGVIVGMPDHGYSPDELAGLGFKRVFSGHYHNHKTFNVGGCDVVSIGALSHQTWSDVRSKAGWIEVYDEDFKFHESKTPKFMDIGDATDPSEYEGNYVRVRGIELEEKEIRELKSTLEDAGALGVIVHAVAKSKITTRGTTASGKSVKIETSINNWIEANENIDKKDEEDVSKAALALLSEVGKS